MSDEKKENDEQERSKERIEGKPEGMGEVAELKDRLLRLAAEFDNYKKRVAKDLDGSKSTGKAELMKKLLTIVDEFELAIAAMGKGSDNIRGVELLFSNFMDILKGEGLKEIDSRGVFDPYKHEIMLAKESNEKEGTILEVVRKGYSVNGMMLRPVSVIVSKGNVQENKQK